MTSRTTNMFSRGVRARAVRMVLDHEDEDFRPEMMRRVARGRHVVATVMGVVKRLGSFPRTNSGC